MAKQAINKSVGLMHVKALTGLLFHQNIRYFNTNLIFRKRLLFKFFTKIVYEQYSGQLNFCRPDFYCEDRHDSIGISAISVSFLISILKKVLD